MAKPQSEVFEVECPCCGATLKIDPAVKAVLHFKEKPAAKTIEDLSAGLQKLREKEAQRDSLFEKQMQAVKSSKDVLASKFDELLKQAKSDPDPGPPKKPFDFD
jgi:cell pole-organizing protein PopZ